MERRPRVRARSRYGNLALLKKSVNKTIGNSSFDEKLAALKGSTYLLTAGVAKARRWDANAISQWQQRMAKLAVDTWPIKAV